MVTPDAKSKVYGDADPALTGTLSGFMAADNVAASYSRVAGETVTGGPYTISATLSPTAVLSNYAISYNTAVLTINKATLTVTANNAQKNEGNANPSFTANYSGFKNNETLATSGVTGSPSLTTTATAASPPGTYPITAALGSLTATNYAFAFLNGTLTIINVAPTVGAITAPLAPQAMGTTINASANFTDPGILDTHTALWTWGDGSSSPGAVAETNGSGSVTGSHVYATDGVFTISLTVTDKDGGAGSSIFQYEVIYNASAGFVTGGGWIASPAGAYVANPAVTGKATFGLNAKYLPGATVPTGNTEFQFPVANLNFHATSYDWLVITGDQGQYQGSGSINGAGNYGFLVTALDGEQPGGGGIDKFRIKIWDKNNGNAVVYDTQPGADLTAAPAIALAGGDITVHGNGNSPPPPRGPGYDGRHAQPPTALLLDGLFASGLETKKSLAAYQALQSRTRTPSTLNFLDHAVLDQLARDVVR